MKKITAILLFTILQNANIHAQTTPPPKAYLGIGAGLDYGGFGIRTTIVANKNIAFFGGAGYNAVELGYNAGIIIKPFTTIKVKPTLLAMYGYNAAIKIKNRTNLSKTYYGFTAGAGVEIPDGKVQKNNFVLNVLVPFRSAEYDKDYERLKPLLTNKPLPITFTIGYNIGLINKKK